MFKMPKPFAEYHRYEIAEAALETLKWCLKVFDTFPQGSLTTEGQAWLEDTAESAQLILDPKEILSRDPHVLERFIEHPDFASAMLMFASDCLPEDVLAHCAHVEPALAIQYAAPFLPIETLSQAVRDLMGSTTGELDDESDISDREDEANLVLEQAGWLITSRDLGWFMRWYPGEVLTYVPARLSAQQREDLALRAPAEALRNASEYLPLSSLDRCARSCPLTALDVAAQHISLDVLRECIDRVRKGEGDGDPEPEADTPEE